MSVESNERKKMVDALKQATIATQELTKEYQESVASHRRNGKLLRNLDEQRKAAAAGN